MKFEDRILPITPHYSQRLPIIILFPNEAYYSKRTLHNSLRPSLGTCPYQTHSSTDIAQRLAKSTFFPPTNITQTAQLRLAQLWQFYSVGTRKIMPVYGFGRTFEVLTEASPVFMERSQIFSTCYTRNRHSY